MVVLKIQVAEYGRTSPYCIYICVNLVVSVLACGLDATDGLMRGTYQPVIPNGHDVALSMTATTWDAVGESKAVAEMEIGKYR